MPDKDVVIEARALLAHVAPGGKITNGADAYLFDMRAPALLSAMADEIEQFRSAHAMQVESIKALHAQERVYREAIEAAIDVLGMSFPGSIKRYDAIAKLRAAITPKGEGNES